MKLFNEVPANKPKGNKFDLSHERKFSLNMGDIVPILCQEVLPGDRFRVMSELLVRFAPMLAPMMHRVNVWCHFFFVPNRLIWDEWEDFITGGRDGLAAPVAPYITLSGSSGGVFENGTLADYLGVPTNPAGTVVLNVQNVNALPFRAYQLVWDEYFRDQNLTASLDIFKGSGQVNAIGGELDKLTTMRKRAWEKDYLTSSLPWAQRGNSAGIPVSGDPAVNYKFPATLEQANNVPAGALTPLASDVGSQLVGGAGQTPLTMENIDSIDIDQLAITVNDLRRSVRLQEWLERNARGGARYVEQILSHWGVKVPDFRLQRPEFLSGSRVPVVVSEVLSNFQFSGDAEGLPQGNMAGHGISVGNYSGFRHAFNEHGYVIGVMSVLPKTAYQQGMPRMFGERSDKFDYAWPEFANIGEQEVRNKEAALNWEQVASTEEGTFGYQSRYAEYKYKESTVHGAFRDSLNYWHMGRIFDLTAGPVVLNEQFVTADPTNRIFAVTDPGTEHLYVQLYHKFDAIRPLPYFGVPRL